MHLFKDSGHCYHDFAQLLFKEYDDININFQNKEGKTALMLLFENYRKNNYGFRDIEKFVTLLIDNENLNPSLKDNKGNSALHYFFTRNRVRSVKKFKKVKCELDFIIVKRLADYNHSQDLQLIYQSYFSNKRTHDISEYGEPRDLSFYRKHDVGMYCNLYE